MKIPEAIPDDHLSILYVENAGQAKITGPGDVLDQRAEDLAHELASRGVAATVVATHETENEYGLPRQMIVGETERLSASKYNPDFVSQKQFPTNERNGLTPYVPVITRANVRNALEAMGASEKEIEYAKKRSIVYSVSNIFGHELPPVLERHQDSNKSYAIGGGEDLSLRFDTLTDTLPALKAKTAEISQSIKALHTAHPGLVLHIIDEKTVHNWLTSNLGRDIYSPQIGKLPKLIARHSGAARTIAVLEYIAEHGVLSDSIEE